MGYYANQHGYIIRADNAGHAAEMFREMSESAAVVRPVTTEAYISYLEEIVQQQQVNITALIDTRSAAIAKFRDISAQLDKVNETLNNYTKQSGH